MNLFSDIRALVIDCLNAMVPQVICPKGWILKMSPWNPAGCIAWGHGHKCSNGFGKTCQVETT